MGQGKVFSADMSNDIALWSSTNQFSLLYIGALPDETAARSLAVDAEWLTQYIHEQRELPRQDALGEWGFKFSNRRLRVRMPVGTCDPRSNCHECYNLRSSNPHSRPGEHLMDTRLHSCDISDGSHISSAWGRMDNTPVGAILSLDESTGLHVLCRSLQLFFVDKCNEFSTRQGVLSQHATVRNLHMTVHACWKQGRDGCGSCDHLQ